MLSERFSGSTLSSSMRSILLCVLAAGFLLPVLLTGCVGSQVQKSGPADGMLKPQDPPSGNSARDKYDEMLREDREEGLDD